MSTSVLVCAPKLFVGGATGGGERYASEFIKAMRNHASIDISVVTGIGYRGLVRRDCESLAELERVSFSGLRRLLRQSDVVHLFQLDSHVADLVLLSAVSSGVPVVLTDLGGGWRAAGRALGRSRYRHIAGLAAISRTSIEDLSWPNWRPATVLYGGGDHLAPVTGVERVFDFVFVGRLVEHKGVHLLLEALPPGARCLVAGAPLDAAYVERLRSLAVGRSVDFLLGPSDEDVIRAYCSARWSVSPTLAYVNGAKVRRPELLGISPLESIALGTPALVSDIPAYAELASHVGMPSFQAGSVKALRDELDRLLSEPLPDLSYPRAEFSWSTVAGKAVSLYRGLSVGE